jgi:hypothetical protein
LKEPAASQSNTISKRNQIRPGVGLFTRYNVDLGVFYIRTLFANTDGLQRLGAGIGVDSYSGASFFLNGRSALSASGFKPHLYGELGLSMSGPIFAAGIGGTLSTGETTDFTIGAGLKWVEGSSRNIMGLTFGIGVEF